MTAGHVRRAVEVVAGRFVIRRRLPCDSGGGLIYASGRVGGLKYLLKRSSHLDAQLLGVASVLVNPGDVVWDVGANVGIFSRAAAYHAGSRGRVIAFEADVDAVVLLQRTARHTPPSDARITILPVAVSDATGFLSFSISQRARAANSISGYGSVVSGGVLEERTVPTLTLDSLLDEFEPPRVLKIDVEGAELRVLQGASRLLSSVRPLVYCEVSGSLRDEFTQLMTSHDYRLWDGDGFASQDRKEVATAAQNTVAIPAELAGRFVSHEG